MTTQITTISKNSSPRKAFSRIALVFAAAGTVVACSHKPDMEPMHFTGADFMLPNGKVAPLAVAVAKTRFGFTATICGVNAADIAANMNGDPHVVALDGSCMQIETETAAQLKMLFAGVQALTSIPQTIFAGQLAAAEASAAKAANTASKSSGTGSTDVNLTVTGGSGKGIGLSTVPGYTAGRPNTVGNYTYIDGVAKGSTANVTQDLNF